MNEASPQPYSSALVAMLALRECIEEEAPYLKVLAVHTFPRPFLRVKDTFHGIVIGFSSEADYRTYVAIVWHMEVAPHD